jgi:hypothetical protein
MANPADILSDPDFVSANAATKQAIFAKHVATDPDFLKANADTQQAIKLRFGFAGNEGMPGARQGVDQFGIPVTIRPPQTEAPLTLREKISGAIETPVALAANLVSGPITYLAGAGGPEFQKKVAGEIQYQPRTRLAQQALETVGQGLEASKIPPFMPMIGGTANALAPAARAAPAVAENALAAARATPLVQAVEAPLVARAAAKQEANVTQSFQNAPRIDAAKDALDLGVALNPATTNPTAANKIRVAVVGGANLETKLAQYNLPQFTNAAKADLGVPNTAKLDSKAFEQSRARPEISKPYEDIRKLESLAADASTMDALEQMKVTPLIGDTGQAAKINGLVDTVKEQVTQGVNGQTLVDSIRQRRRDAQAIYNQQSKGINPPSPEAIAQADINMGIANALEGMIESNIGGNPKMLGAFREARAAMAKTYDYERATNFATGQIDPQVIAKMAAEGKPLTGTLAKIGNVAANYPEVSKGGVLNAPTWRETLPRSGAAGTVGAILGSPLGLPGSIAGGAFGAAAGNVASGVMARGMTRPSFQAAKAMPPDYRPPVNQLTPAEINYGPNQMVPYNYGQSVVMPGETPNFVFGRPEGQVNVSTPYAPNQLPAPSAESTMAGVAAERARAAQMSRILGQQTEVQQAAAEAAARRPTGGGSVLEFDPITGTYKVGGAGVKGATPEVFMSDTGRNLNTASQKVAAGQNFALSAAEKVAWEKTKVDLAAAAPELKGLSDKAIANKMMDREWADGAITKARQQAQAFDEIAARATTDQARRMAEMKREQMLDVLNTLEDQLRAPRPTSLGGQGPKTRAAIRNKLVPQDTGNAQFNFLSGQ